MGSGISILVLNLFNLIYFNFKQENLKQLKKQGDTVAVT